LEQGQILSDTAMCGVLDHDLQIQLQEVKLKDNKLSLFMTANILKIYLEGDSQPTQWLHCSYTSVVLP
jgi:hypothetical protein